MFLATKVSSLLVATAFFVLPALTATASPQNLLYIQLSNYGRCAISDIWVKWREDGKTKSQKFTGDVLQGQSACFDLSKIGPTSNPSIPEGVEVWIDVQIAIGEKKSCRKDKKHYYKSSSTSKWFVYMAGDITQNNRCRNGDSGDSFKIHAGNSKACQ